MEDKELLLKDLSARLPYGVKVRFNLYNDSGEIFANEIGELQSINKYGEASVNSKGIDYRFIQLDCKPYLRPMSSMTEEEKAYIRRVILPRNLDVDNVGDLATVKNEWTYIPMSSIEEYMDFLLRKHLDYRGLIPRNIALKAKEDMYD